MTVKKFAISVPEEVMAAVDRAAAEKGITRSRLIADVLARVAVARTDAEVTRRIDEVLQDESLLRRQADEARAYQSAAVTAGTEW